MSLIKIGFMCNIRLKKLKKRSEIIQTTYEKTSQTWIGNLDSLSWLKNLFTLSVLFAQSCSERDRLIK